MSDVYLGFTIRPVTAREKFADNECYNCEAEVSYIVEPQNVKICAACAYSDIARFLGAQASPVSAYIPQGLTREQRMQVAKMTIPPRGIRLRPFTLMQMEPLEGGHRRRRIVFEYEIPDGEPL